MYWKHNKPQGDFKISANSILNSREPHVSITQEVRTEEEIGGKKTSTTLDQLKRMQYEIQQEDNGK